MPSIGITPEALLGRNDSKNPATTCKGITSAGRACRRAIKAESAVEPNKPSSNGVIAIVHNQSELQEARYYCWQHKDQVQEVANSGRGVQITKISEERLKAQTLREKSSIDTLALKLGIVDIGSNKDREKSKPLSATRYESRHQQRSRHEITQDRPSTILASQNYSTQNQERRQRQHKGFWSALCCMRSDESDDYIEVIRHRKRIKDSQQQMRQTTTSSLPHTPSRPLSSSFVGKTQASAPGVTNAGIATFGSTPARSPKSNPKISQYKFLIPQHCSPQTASALLAELAKPISHMDEPGYIYIFWLTPETKATPAQQTARSILESDSRHNDRRISDAMTEYSYENTNDDPSISLEAQLQGGQKGMNKKKSIMLKIGRASNVTRRLNEWQRQCGYALTLLRWYPYISTSSTLPNAHRSPQGQVQYPDLSRSPALQPPQSLGNARDSIRKVPCVKRVERLIHLELEAQQVKRRCGNCGKEHREWFEVEASRAGVKAVDETVKRWVSWAERWSER